MIRVGVRLLFFYLVLAIGVQLANQWAAAIAAACKPVTTAVPMISSYFVPPSKIMTTVCSGFIPTSAMLNYAALALAFAAMTIGIPHTVSSFSWRFYRTRTRSCLRSSLYRPDDRPSNHERPQKNPRGNFRFCKRK